MVLVNCGNNCDAGMIWYPNDPDNPEAGGDWRKCSFCKNGYVAVDDGSEEDEEEEDYDRFWDD